MLDLMIDNSKIERIGTLVSEKNNCVILTHSRPDGDAMGSSLALAMFLKNMGKTVSVITPNDFPPFLKWMPSLDSVVVYDNDISLACSLLEKADLFFCLDFNSFSRIDDVGKIAATVDAERVLIDHHLNPDDVFDVSVSHPEACSTSELVFRVICRLGGLECVTKEMAECIYTGIMTDTGNFAYASGRKDVYLIVADLISKGIDKDLLYRKVFYNYSFGRMKLLGYMMYEKLRFYPKRNAALLTLDNDELKRFNMEKGDTEGFVNMPLQIKGVRFSCFLREETKGKINVSLRSVDDFPCNKVAQEFFNGGGHKNASGGEVNGSMKEAVALFAEALERYSDELLR